MEINKLWKNFKFPKCENCEKDCKGHLDYSNLCSNLNYLEEYAEKNFEKNKESFNILKKLINETAINVFSFGCGLGFDFIGAQDVFGNTIKYFGIDECDWAIKKTKEYNNFTPKLPKTIKYEDGIFLLSAIRETPIICFFNSLFTISNNSNLDKDLIKALENKTKFYIICNFTINSNFHMPKEEFEFIKKLKRNLSRTFKFKQFEILDGKGIIICGER